MIARSTILLAILAGATTLRAAPQFVNAYKVTKPPVIDGVVDEVEEWKQVPSFEGMVDSSSRQAAPEGARFWLAYDDRYIYFAAKLHDSLPNSIRAIEYRTNVGLGGEDYVQLDVSPSGNLTDFDQFQMNAKGGTNVRLAGGRAAKREWTGDMLSKGRVTKDGWEVEARIPWSLFRLPGSGKHDFRFNVERSIPRLSQTYVYGFTADGLSANTPIYAGVLVPKRPVDHSINLLPYIYAGADAEQGFVFNSGLDLKTKLTEGVTLVGSINPDFRNIENQVLSLDFSRFERLAGESRPFFQEGSGYIGSNLFASQRISRFDVGLNAYGKVDPRTQFALLDAVSFGHEEDLVSTVGFTPRPTESYRATVTRRELPGAQNNAFLFRYSKDLGSYNVFLREEESSDSSGGWGGYENAALNYNHNGIFSAVILDRVTPKFNPALGFQPEVNYQGTSAFFGYDHQVKRGPVQDHGYAIFASSFRHVSGGFYRDDVDWDYHVTTRNQADFGFNADFARFEADKDHAFAFHFGFPVNDQRRNFTAGYTTGVQQNQAYRNLFFNGNYLVGVRLTLAATYQVVRLGDTYSEQAILSGNYDLGHDRSVSGRLLQKTQGTNFFLSFQQSGNRGTEYYLILGTPNASLIDNRNYLINVRPSIILKVVKPFQIG